MALNFGLSPRPCLYLPLMFQHVHLQQSPTTLAALLTGPAVQLPRHCCMPKPDNYTRNWLTRNLVARPLTYETSAAIHVHIIISVGFVDQAQFGIHHHSHTCVQLAFQVGLVGQPD